MDVGSIRKAMWDMVSLSLAISAVVYKRATVSFAPSPGVFALIQKPRPCSNETRGLKTSEKSCVELEVFPTSQRGSSKGKCYFLRERGSKTQ